MRPLRDEIFNEIKARTQETDLAVPAQAWRLLVFDPHRGGPAVPPVGPDGRWSGWRRDRAPRRESRLPKAHDYFRLANFSVAPDAATVGYSVDTDGGERYTTRFRNTATLTDLPDEIPDTYYGAAWASDSLHYFYTTTDAAMRPWQVWRHRLGSDRSADVLVYQEDDDRYYLSVWRSRSGGFIFIGAESAITSDVRCIPADDPEAEPIPGSSSRRRCAVRR